MIKMNQKKHLILCLILLLSLSITSIGTGVYAHTESDPFVKDLIAGQHYDVGDVIIWNDGMYLYVKYTTDPGFQISETHLSVATNPIDIPQKNGNPTPGKFEYSTEHDPMVNEFTYEIPNMWDPDEDLFIAAHAVICGAGLSDLELALPDQVTMQVTYPYVGGPSYLPMVTISGGTILDGVYHGWCADTDQDISENTPYTADVYSSYEPLPAGKIEYPENLDLVNWILNQDYVGQSGPYGTYTYGDVQRAIWALLEDQQSDSGLGPWDQNRVDEILAAATTNGEGFVPGCGEKVVIILNPEGEVAQIVLITIPFPCLGCETAWGDGPDFIGKNWATYIEYTVQADLIGDWIFVYHYGADYVHEMTITDQDSSTFSGTGKYPEGGPYTITWTVTGTYSGNAVEFHIDYDSSSYYIDATGTINPDGTMSGSATAPGQEATWTAYRP